jgi:hypothetical protein
MKNKGKIFWFLLLIFPFQIFSQVSITGTVTDGINNQFIPYATVYVNGTTKGTITNPVGQFTLENVNTPCELVISHISYTTKVITLKNNIDTLIHIMLNPGEVELGVVEVKDKNLREANLTNFKKRFLGTDYWGKGAKIENDSVLVFHRKKVSEVERGSLVSGLLAVDTSSTLFIVDTKGPLMVNLPLLGYKLHINLIHYTELQTGVDTDYEFHTLGYFYFQPEDNASNRKTNRFERKRLEAYYHSDRHFCRSLFNDRLMENGYMVRDDATNPKIVIKPNTRNYTIFPNITNSEIEQGTKGFDNHITRTDSEVKIVGLKNKNYRIKYYEKKNAPKNLKEDVGLPSSTSQIYFLKDTCTIRADGSRPDNSIMFGPVIGNKRVGAMLPYDFQFGNEK